MSPGARDAGLPRVGAGRRLQHRGIRKLVGSRGAFSILQHLVVLHTTSNCLRNSICCIYLALSGSYVFALSSPFSLVLSLVPPPSPSPLLALFYPPFLSLSIPPPPPPHHVPPQASGDPMACFEDLSSQRHLPPPFQSKQYDPKSPALVYVLLHDWCLGAVHGVDPDRVLSQVGEAVCREGSFSFFACHCRLTIDHASRSTTEHHSYS